MKPLLIAALAATGMLACACTSQATTPVPHATVTVTAHPAIAATPNPASPGGSGSSPQASGGSAGSQVTSQNAGSPGSQGSKPAGCITRYLGIAVHPNGDAGSSVYVTITFKNLNNTACTLYGFPGVSFAGGMPVTDIGQPSQENAATPRRLVTVQPGGIAWTQLQIVDAVTYPTAQCHPEAADFLSIIPPNTSNPAPIAYNGTVCAGTARQLTVNAVQLGMNP